MADTTSTEATDSSVDTPEWLFSFGASDVEASSNRKGHMKFVYKAESSTEVTAFTDRPDRLTDRLPMKKLANSFDTIFADGKPNASLTHWGRNGSFHNHVHEILKIKKKGNKYTIKTNLLEDDYIGEIFPDGMDGGSNALGTPNPFAIAQANFFIDNGLWKSIGEGISF